MSRCTCCDRVLTPSELVWYEERKAWEDLCWTCKADAFALLPVKTTEEELEDIANEQ